MPESAWNALPTWLIEINNNDWFYSKITDFLIAQLLMVCVLYVP